MLSNRRGNSARKARLSSASERLDVSAARAADAAIAPVCIVQPEKRQVDLTGPIAYSLRIRGSQSTDRQLNIEVRKGLKERHRPKRCFFFCLLICLSRRRSPQIYPFDMHQIWWHHRCSLYSLINYGSTLCYSNRSIWCAFSMGSKFPAKRLEIVLRG